MSCIPNLQEIVQEAMPLAQKGKVADYIPALQHVNPNIVSAAIYERRGVCTTAGDTSITFTLQSVSKVLTLALALMDVGTEAVFSKVGMEPTGDPFHSIIKLETSSSKPLNPMINAGALAVTSMIQGKDTEEKVNRILAFVAKMTGNPKISYSEEVAASEFETAFLNRSLCYFMKQHGVIAEDVEQLLEVYTKQCAIEVNCEELARIGAVFAFNGIDPVTEDVIIPADIARLCKTFMVTCGMYNASGEFAIKVGIPAKSGVSGAILASVLDKFGIGIYSPALNEQGNSIAGIEILAILSKQYNLSIF